MGESSYDAAIVGAGPAGSATAAALAQFGWRVLLVEQDRLPRHKVCGEFLSPEAQSSLRRLGLRAAVDVLRPVALRNAEITAPGGQHLQVPLPGSAMGLSRYALDAALASAAEASGVTLLTGFSVVEVVESDGAYALHLRKRSVPSVVDGTMPVHARLAILASGRHSRFANGSAESRATLGEGGRRWLGIKCHYDVADLPASVALYFFDGGYVGINPVEGGRANVCMLITYDEFRKSAKSPAAMLDVLRGRHAGLNHRLAGARMAPESLKTVAAVNTSQPAVPWRGAPCVGDAAAMITPLCGDGMAMALRSAELCAPLADAFLRGQMGRSEMADAYTCAWHREFDGRLRVGRLLQSALGTPALANVLIGAGKAAPPLVRHLVHATRGSS